MTRRCGALALLALGLSSQAAAAAPAPGVDGLTVTWTVPAQSSCPGSPELLARVVELAPRSSEGPSTRASVQAIVQRLAGAGWQVRMRTERDGVVGDRKLQAASCGALAEATAVIIAWLLTPDEAPEVNVDEATPAPTRTVFPGPDAKVRSTPARAPAESVSWGLFAAASADSGTLPGLAVGPLLGSSLRGRHFGTLVAGEWYSGSGNSPIRMGAGGNFILGVASIELIFSQDLAREPALVFESRVGGCLSWMRAKGQGVSDPRTSTSSWASLTAGFGLRWQFTTQWALGLRGIALVPTVRHRFAFEDIGEVYAMRPLGFRVSLGPSWTF